MLKTPSKSCDLRSYSGSPSPPPARALLPLARRGAANHRRAADFVNSCVGTSQTFTIRCPKIGLNFEFKLRKSSIGSPRRQAPLRSPVRACIFLTCLPIENEQIELRINLERTYLLIKVVTLSSAAAGQGRHASRRQPPARSNRSHPALG